jgi:hypothetical protein
MITLKVRGTSRNGDIVAAGTNWDAINRQVRAGYGRRAFAQLGSTVLGDGMREGMILQRVGRSDDHSVLENVIVLTAEAEA